MTVFEFDDYKAYIKKMAAASERQGYLARLAEAAGCQKSYFSQVLNSKVQLTPDHAIGLTQFWEMLPGERDYFIELVNFARANSEKLRKHTLSKLKELKDENNNLTKRFKRPTLETQNLQIMYYSVWYYSAIHILLTIPGFRNVPKICERLLLSNSEVLEALQVLQQLGLIEHRNNEWFVISFELHLPRESPLTSTNNSNWRQKAVLNSHSHGEESLHYTGVHSMSTKDYEELKGQIVKFISSAQLRIRDSKEEELVSFCCDFFRV